MALDDLKIENSNLKYELKKINNLYENLQEQIVNLLNFGEMAVFECDKDYKIISSYGAVDAIFRNLNPSYGKFNNLIDLLNYCINPIDDNDVEIAENQEPFFKIDVKNTLITFISETKKKKNIDLFGKLTQNNELYILNLKLAKEEFTVSAYIRFLPFSFFLQKFEQKIKSELESKDLLISNIFNSVNHGMILLDARSRILLINQVAKDHHFSDESKILKNAQLSGRLYRDIFTNESNEDFSERQRHHDKAFSKQKKVKYSKITNGKMVHFELVPILNELELPNGMFVFTNVDNPAEINLEVKMNKLTHLAKHFKNENDSLNERVKELELNQNWLMKKNEETIANNKLLHESLRQIYFYLEILPFPMAVLEIPSGKYQFVNNEYLKLIKLEKRAVLNKIDEQIFPDSLAAELTSRTAESLRTKKNITFLFLGNSCKQFLIENNDSKHILRIFNVECNER